MINSIPNTYLPEDLRRCAYLDPAVAQPKITATPPQSAEKTEKAAADFFALYNEELRLALTVSLIALCIATCVMLMVYINFVFLILLVDGAAIYGPLCYALAHMDLSFESKKKSLEFADKELNREAFKKPLVQADFPPLPEGTAEDLYKELPTLCDEVMKGEEDENEVKYMAGIWVSRTEYKKELNHLVLLYKEKVVDPDGKKIFFRRLNSNASRGCSSGVRRELSALYRDLSGREIATQVGDPVLRVQNKVQNENEVLREKIAERLAGNNPHEWNSTFYKLNRVISLPGAANAQDEGGYMVTYASKFFKEYTSQRIVQHFTQVINEGELNSETKKREFKISKEEELIDWFKANAPEGYEGREYEFLEEVVFMENTWQDTYKAGQIKPLAIQYLLYKCGILNHDPLSERILEKQALQQASNPRPKSAATVD